MNYKYIVIKVQGDLRSAEKFFKLRDARKYCDTLFEFGFYDKMYLCTFTKIRGAGQIIKTY